MDFSWVTAEMFDAAFDEMEAAGDIDYSSIPDVRAMAMEHYNNEILKHLADAYEASEARPGCTQLVRCPECLTYSDIDSGLSGQHNESCSGPGTYYLAGSACDNGDECACEESE